MICSTRANLSDPKPNGLLQIAKSVRCKFDYTSKTDISV